MNQITPVVKQLLIINVLFFIGSQLVPDGYAYELFSLYYPESHNFRIWQPLTHMFMHAPMPQISHLLFNMFALYSFGSTLEHFWGGKRFLIFYLICGFGASLIHMGSSYYYFHDGLNYLTNNNLDKLEILKTLNENKVGVNWINLMPEKVYNNFIQSFISTAVGASGAIYGLLVAFAMMFPDAKLGIMFIPIPIKAKYFVPIFMLLYDGFFGIFGFSFLAIGSGIAHFAHIGGALTGFILMMLWRNKKFNFNRLN